MKADRPFLCVVRAARSLCVCVWTIIEINNSCRVRGSVCQPTDFGSFQAHYITMAISMGSANENGRETNNTRAENNNHKGPQMFVIQLY